MRAAAAAVVRPALLSGQAVTAVVRTAADGEASDELCAAVYAACGGNPLYLTELLRTAELSGRPLAVLEPAELLAGGLEGVARQVITRVRSLGPGALGLAQALAVLGDGSELRHAASIAGITAADAARLAAGLAGAEVLAAGDRPRFVHPVIRDALEASLDGWFGAFPDAHVAVYGLHVAGDVAVEEGTFTGTHVGVLHSPAGDIPPTGRPVSVNYIQVLRFRDGQHTLFNLMYDRLLLLEQLGLTLVS